MNLAERTYLAKTLYDLIILNGGVTWNLHRGNLGGKDEWAVSIDPDASVVVEVEDFGPSVVAHFLHDNRTILDDSTISFGGWIDRETNRVYLDLSWTTPSREDAEALARAYDQIAIYNLKTQEEVRL